MRDGKAALRLLRGTMACVVAAIAASLAPVAAAADDGSPQCTRASSPTALKPGAPLFTPVKLEAEEPAPINLSGDDFEEVTVKAEPPLPARVTGKQLSLYTPKRLRRSDDNGQLGTAHVDKPTFSEPEISAGGGRIVFTVCIDDESIDAGTYTGQVQIDGPLGATRTAATITVNKKNSALFVGGVALALLIAAALSYLRAVKAAKDQLPETAPNPWKEAWSKTWRDFWLLASTLIGLGVALFGMWQIYDKDVAWGASQAGSVFALIGTTLSATGLAAFTSTFLPSRK